MTQLGSKHFYIYEPVQLLEGDVVVPVFFFQHNQIMKAKCLKLHTRDEREGVELRMEIEEELEFDSEEYLTIDVADFVHVYKEIKLQDGRFLSDVVVPEIWRK